MSGTSQHFDFPIPERCAPRALRRRNPFSLTTAGAVLRKSYEETNAAPNTGAATKGMTGTAYLKFVGPQTLPSRFTIKPPDKPYTAVEWGRRYLITFSIHIASRCRDSSRQATIQFALQMNLINDPNLLPGETRRSARMNPDLERIGPCFSPKALNRSVGRGLLVRFGLLSLKKSARRGKP